MFENVIKKLFPIRDEKGRPCTFPTFGSQVFGEDEEKRALWQAGKGFYADHAKDTERLDGKDSVYFHKKFSNPHNLLDNSWFGGMIVDGMKQDMVAQAGFNAYHGSVLYLADRWKCYADSALTPADGYITITEGSMWQKVKGLDATKTYTFAVMGMDGNIRIMTGSPFVEYVGGTDWGIVEGDGIPCFRVTTGSWVWAALYEGEYTADNLPPYIYKGYAAELAECQRYLRIIGAGGVNSNMHAGYAQAATTTVANACITIGDMRSISPSYKLVGNCVIRKGTADTTVSITDMSVHHGVAYIQLSAANLTAGDMYALRFTNGGHFIISADL